MDNLYAEVAHIRSNTVAGNSRAQYDSSSAKFITWLLANKQELLTDQFRNRMQELRIVKVEGSTLRDTISAGIQPIKFDELRATDFMLWIASLRTNRGARPGYSTYNSHRFEFCLLLMLFLIHTLTL